MQMNINQIFINNKRYEVKAYVLRYENKSFIVELTLDTPDFFKLDHLANSQFRFANIGFATIAVNYEYNYIELRAEGPIYIP